ncbi:hypothetical protein YC68_23625 [Vibrio parahaemolyticus]|nr:hypothetical protein YC68_23625 [Vibrio parahaemolyticus]
MRQIDACRWRKGAEMLKDLDTRPQNFRRRSTLRSERTKRGTAKNDSLKNSFLGGWRSKFAIATACFARRPASEGFLIIRTMSLPRREPQKKRKSQDGKGASQHKRYQAL